jgi:hypothetical protein
VKGDESLEECKKDGFHSRNGHAAIFNKNSDSNERCQLCRSSYDQFTTSVNNDWDLHKISIPQNPHERIPLKATAISYVGKINNRRDAYLPYYTNNGNTNPANGQYGANRWQSNNLGNKEGWIQYDMGESMKVNQIRVYNFGAYNHDAKSILLEYSMDSVNWNSAGVHEIKPSDQHSRKRNLPTIIHLGSQFIAQPRYWKLTIKSYWNPNNNVAGLLEVDFFNVPYDIGQEIIPVGTAGTGGANGHRSHPAAINGNPNVPTASGGDWLPRNAINAWNRIDLGEAIIVRQIHLYNTAYNNKVKTLKLQYSNNTSTFTDYKVVTLEYVQHVKRNKANIVHLNEDIKARYWKFTILTTYFNRNQHAGLTAIQFFGVPVEKKTWVHRGKGECHEDEQTGRTSSKYNTIEECRDRCEEHHETYFSFWEEEGEFTCRCYKDCDYLDDQRQIDTFEILSDTVTDVLLDQDTRRAMCLDNLNTLTNVWQDCYDQSEDLKTDLATSEANLDTCETNLDSTKTTLDTTKATLDTTKKTLDTTKATLDTTKKTLDTTKATLDTTKKSLDTTKATLDTTKKTLDTTKATLDTTKANLETTKANLATTKTNLNTAKANLATTKQKLANTEKNLKYYKDLADFWENRFETAEKLSPISQAKKEYPNAPTPPTFEADVGVNCPPTNVVTGNTFFYSVFQCVIAGLLGSGVGFFVATYSNKEEEKEPLLYW